MNQLNIEGLKHGYWEEKFNGGITAKGNFINGKRDGYWEAHFNSQKLAWKGKYNIDIFIGYWEDYYANDGILRRKTFYL